MSRGDENAVKSTAAGQNATSFGNSQTAFGDTQDAIGDYGKQLSKFVSGNPYAKGSEYDSTINTGLSNTSDAGADSLAGALQSQSLRTGQNSAANAATASSAAQANTRALSGDLAKAQADRIGNEASYDKDALGASATPISANQSLYSTSLGGAGNALNTQADVSKTPGFWDTLGDSFGGVVGSGLGKNLVTGG